MKKITANEAPVPWLGEDWFDPLEAGVRQYAVRNPGQAGSVIAKKFYAMALCRTRSGSQGTALASGIFRRAPR